MRTEAINAIGRNSNWLPHAVLWLGVFITAFPLYITFVASTLLPQDIAQVPMQMLPRPALLGQLQRSVVERRDRDVSVATGQNAVVQFADRGAGGDIRQNYREPALGLRGGVLQISGPHDFFLDDFHHADAAGGGTHSADLFSGDGLASHQ